MMDFANKGYSELLDKYIVVYESDDYELHIRYPGLKEEPTDGALNNADFVVLRKDESLPYIVFEPTKADEEPYAKAFIQFERSVQFYDMGQETGVWAKAQQGIKDIDGVVKTVFPGYRVI